ncbi:unnamed protein product, partial [Phaeothamnion confervicola]
SGYTSGGSGYGSGGGGGGGGGDGDSGAVEESPEEALDREHRQLTCDLLTIFMQMHGCWPFLEHATPLESRRIGRGSSFLCLRLSWFAISPAAAAAAAMDGCSRVSQWGPDEFSEFLAQYGAYVDLDAAAAAATAREWS